MSDYNNVWYFAEDVCGSRWPQSQVVIVAAAPLRLLSAGPRSYDKDGCLLTTRDTSSRAAADQNKIVPQETRHIFF